MNAIIIDDHPLAIAAIRNLLIKNDIEILAELTEGGSAVQRVETLKPDIVIIDVDIPGVNGIQVLETLRKRQYSGIIIIVSAKNDHFYGKHCADAGANGFVSKKEGMNNIIAAIEAAKNGYCYFPFSLNRFVGSLTLMNPLMILVKIIKLRWIHILSYDQMVSRKINNQTTRCANSIFYTTLFTNSAPNYT